MSSLRIVLRPNRFSRARAAYVFSQLLDTLGYFYDFLDDEPEPAQDDVARSSHLILYYGPPDPAPPAAAIVIPEQANPLPDHLLAALGDPDSAHHFQPAKPGQRRSWSYDLIRAAFYLLSRQEELDNRERDSLDRFSTEQSLLHKLGLIERPILNEAALILDGLIRQAAAERGLLLLKKSAWPHPYHYAASLSHDIDDLGYRDPLFALRCLGQFARTGRTHALRKGLGTLLQWGRNRLTGQSYARWYLDEWLRLEEQAGFRSTFFFVAAGNRKSSYDPNYDVTEPRLAAQLRSMVERGWEVGVHGSFDSYRSAERTRAERERLEAVLGGPAAGIRQHYLRLAVPETWRCQQQAGYGYDATLGFRDRLGFRAGLTTPFRPYDLRAETPFLLLEMPLVMMDGSLFWGHNLNPEAAFSTALAYARRTRDVQGHLTLLWHQYTFDGRSRPGWWTVYGQLVEHLAREQAAYVVPLAGAANWWTARQHLAVAGETTTADGRRILLRAGRTLPDRLRLDICGSGWRPVKLSCGKLISPQQAPPGGAAAVVLPPLETDRTISLEFRPESINN